VVDRRSDCGHDPATAVQASPPQLQSTSYVYIAPGRAERVAVVPASGQLIVILTAEASGSLRTARAPPRFMSVSLNNSVAWMRMRFE
jgi:hypothetical protein